MISSKALLDDAGISRATLNNYIQLGILPKPVIRSQSNDLLESGARLLGYFPEDALERVQAIKILKEQGFSMIQIADRLSSVDGLLQDSLQDGNIVNRRIENKVNEIDKGRKIATEDKQVDTLKNLSISLEDLNSPAYMFNFNFELSWLNDAARKNIFGFNAPPDKISERNLLYLLSHEQVCLDIEDQQQIVKSLFEVASSCMTYEALSKILINSKPEYLSLLQDIDFSVTSPQKKIHEFQFCRMDLTGKALCCQVYAICFREGILVVHSSEELPKNDLLEFLSRRDKIAKSLLSQRLPVLTPLAVIVADLQDSVKICSELPPDEYFALINHIWAETSPILCKYSGTHGKHVGDGMVYYFFPNVESSYLFNAVVCAHELRQVMREISAHWQLKKNWFRELHLNIGLHEGQEWLGTLQSKNHIEFTVLGNTINEASRLSDFSRYGKIWASKNLVSKLSIDERNCIEFGIVRKNNETGEQFIGSTYALIESLLDLQKDKYEKLRDISQLAVTEICRVSLSK
jgi:class 3 adenylate cyclase/DNA-binding transcriptional MerR regulator